MKSQQQQSWIDERTVRLRRQEPEVGHLIAAIDYKRDMVERFGVEGAFLACRDHLKVPGLDRLNSRPVVSLLEVAQEASTYKLLWSGGRRFVHPAPEVVGDGDQSDQTGVSRSAYLTCLEDVAIRGRSSVILQADRLIVDFENDELTSFADNPELDPGILCARGDIYWTMEPDQSPWIADEAFMLSGNYSHDFGHWLTDYLPKLAIALMAGVPEVPILVDRSIPRSHLESLEWLCPWAEIVAIPPFAHRRVRRLWCASNLVYRGWYPNNFSDAWAGMMPDPDNFAAAIGKLKQMANLDISEDTGFQRVFLARRPERKKRLINHAEIEAEAAEHGFHVVYPEDVSFAEQMRLVHHARFIIAPDGSNGLLSYFADRDARVCFLNSPHTRPLVELNGILRALGADFTVVTGPVASETEEPFWNDYRIDEIAFRAFLQRWLTDVQASG